MRQTSRYRERAATEIACRLLAAIGGMTRMKIIKLMYIIEHEAILRWGYAVTGDKYVAMEHGPMLSRTYDNIKESSERQMARYGDITLWTSYIDSDVGNNVSLRKPCDFAELSEAVIGLVEEVITKHGHKTPGQLRAYTHRYPEWSNPSPDNVKDISIRDLLVKNGVGEDDATGIIEDMEAFALAERVLGKV